jgi:thiol-disulfide isomerase/thioredoxin
VSKSGTPPGGYSSWPRWVRWPLEAGVFLLVFFLIQQWQANKLLPVDEQQLAPTLQGSLLDGGELDVASLRGRPTLVYFFAPWCKVCAFSASSLQGLREAYDADELGIVMVALSYENIESVRAFRDRHELRIPIILGDQAVATRWNIFGVPTYYVLDSQGHVASRDYGLTTMPGLRLRVLGTN